MESEIVRYGVLLAIGSTAEKIFGESSQTTISGHRVLDCSEIDLSGFHSKLCVVPRPTPTHSCCEPCYYWIQTSEISAVIDLQGGTQLGFLPKANAYTQSQPPLSGSAAPTRD